MKRTRTIEETVCDFCEGVKEKAPHKVWINCDSYDVCNWHHERLPSAVEMARVFMKLVINWHDDEGDKAREEE